MKEQQIARRNVYRGCGEGRRGCGGDCDSGNVVRNRDRGCGEILKFWVRICGFGGRLKVLEWIGDLGFWRWLSVVGEDGEDGREW